MNNVTNAFKKIISGEAKFSDFNIDIKECSNAAKALGIKDFEAKLLNAKFRDLAFNELYENYKANSTAN